MNTVTYKCIHCGQELTFYDMTSDGYKCVCDSPLYRPISRNIRDKEDVKATRALYKEQWKKSPKISLEDALHSKYGINHA